MRYLRLTLAILIVLAPVTAEEVQEGGTVLTTAEIITFIGTTDAGRAKAFYQNHLGLRLISEEPSHAVVFDARR